MSILTYQFCIYNKGFHSFVVWEGFYFADQQKGNHKRNVGKGYAVQNSGRTDGGGKSEGVELTQIEAETYLAELTDVELDDKVLKNVAGGSSRCWHCLDNCGVDNCPCRD